MRRVNTKQYTGTAALRFLSVGGCLVAGVLLACLPGCTFGPAEGAAERINPYTDLPVLPIDGETRELANTIAPLGTLEVGRVVNVFIEGAAVQAVLILGEDELFEESGVIVGGGPANQAFDYLVPETGGYFVFVQLAGDATGSELEAAITLTDGDASFAPPAGQAVVIRFEDGYLSDPGLFDPESGTVDEQALLESISGQVRTGIVERLQTIFEGTPIDVTDESDGLPEGVFSIVTISPERRVAADNDFAVDSAIPVAADPACADRVIFGEVFPEGTTQDPGNRVLDDEAIVYVGSFQGRGETCRTAATNSINNVILGISQTAAHEIGHLVGLYHVALVDLMDRSPSRAFQRELSFSRGQVLTEALVEQADGSTMLTTTVLTTVIQDPDRYFRSAFSR